MAAACQNPPSKTKLAVPMWISFRAEELQDGNMDNESSSCRHNRDMLHNEG